VEGRAAAEAASRGKSHVERPQPADDPELAAQNRLFADAMKARARGDLGGAVRLLDRLLRRYPGSVLAEDARVERFRALARLGDHRGAAAAARAYLLAYPGGFAHDEARELAGGGR
jgi:outer membrane protein assembly factor BamD (BamD/ComL family)